MAQGEVSIRFSVQDAETVRQALANLGKDGEAALGKLDAAGGKPGPGMRALSTVTDQLKGSIVGLAYSAGPLGSVLLALGPTGLAVAATFGAITSALDAIKERSKAFGEYAREVKDAGESTGFTTTQIQALTDLLGRHGVASEQATAGLQRFTAEQVSAAQGGGELYTQLKRISPAMAEAFASARTPAAALDVLSKAISSVDQQTGILLSKLAFGKGSGGFSATLQDLAGQGGIGAITAAAQQAGIAIDENLIKKQADAAVAAQEKAKLVERNWNAAAASIYAAWKDFKKTLGFGDDWSVKLSFQIRDEVAGKSLADLGLMAGSAIASGFWTALGKLSVVELAKSVYSGASAAASGVKGLLDGPTLADRLGPFKNAGSTPQTLDDVRRAQGAQSDQANRQAELNDHTRAVALERERLGLLGDTASTSEKVRGKQQELNLALEQGKNITAAEAKLVEDAYKNQAQAADIAIRTSLGVASADERRSNFVDHLNILLREGKIDQDQMSAALSLYNKQLKETVENEQVRAAALPNLERMQLDAANLNKTLDTFGTSVATDVGNAFTGIVSGTQSASDGFKALEQAVITSLARMVYQMTIAKLMAQSLNSALSFFGLGGGGSGPVSGAVGPTSLGGAPLVNAFGNAFAGGRLLPFAKGGVLNSPIIFPMANGAGIAGEAGPEAVMPLRRGRNGKLGVELNGDGSSGGATNNITIINNSGGSAQTTEQQNSSGGVDLRVEINRAVKDGIARGEFDGTMGARFGNKTGTVRR